MNSSVTESSLAELQQLIQESRALRDEERQSWLDLLPTMNGDQLTQLRSILTEEQQTVTEIDKKYDGQLQAVGEKYLQRWDSEKSRSERIQRREQERASVEEAQEKAEDLLKSW